MLAGRYRDLDADSRDDLYQEAWAAVLKARGEVGDVRAYLLEVAARLAAKRVYGADARRRSTFDPLSGPLIYATDHSASPEEAALSAEDARRVRLLANELDEPERAVLKLRLDLGLDRLAIQARLGLSERQYRRIAERATKAMIEQVRGADSGAWERRKRSLLCACVFGVASERQRERARRLIEQDPASRAIMGELRGLGRRAAALLPLPAAPVATDRGRLAELAAAAKEQALGAVGRAADPTPLAGARPGAVGAVIASCIAAGGGAYCAVEGVPDAIKPVVGVERPVEKEPAKAPQAADPPAPPDVAAPVAQPQQAPTPQPSASASAPAARPEPVPRPEREFQPQAAPAPSPAPAPRAPATGGGGGEFGP